MGLSLKSIGHALQNVGNAINPFGHVIRSAVAAPFTHQSVGDIGRNLLTDSARGAGGAAVLGAGYLAAPAVGLGGGAAGAGAGATGAAGAAAAGGLTGVLKSVGSGLLGAAPLALGAYGAYENAQQAKQGADLQQQAIDMAKQRAAELAPLRTAGLAGALDAYQHHVSPLDAVGGYVDSGNPYSHTPSGGAAPPPPPAPSPVMQAALSPNLGGVAPLALSPKARTATPRRSAR